MDSSTTFISASRLRVRRPSYLPSFFRYVVAIKRQVERAPGFLGGRLLYESGNTFWTLTSWEDEQVMRNFQTSGAHRSAMPKLLEWCDEAAVVHWDQTSTSLPDWQTVYQRLTADGRMSKVHFPSRDQQTGKTSKPLWSPFELRLKPVTANG